MCLRRCLFEFSFLAVRGIGYLFFGFVELLFVLAVSRVVWILVAFGLTGSLVIFGVSEYMKSGATTTMEKSLTFDAHPNNATQLNMTNITLY
ncbi:uncharacterized protein Dvir_GJ11454 [Drosophila virilis]|uniref:Uncharacterized protein n=1 Tax=Drosophila virilis TaxID=7244 RepID=B4LH76_DROVI|nr:uncharacterized protein Dvir_GJ11454 [Drosophila virilis]